MSNLAKVRKPEVILELDKERRLKYTLNSFAEMEEKYGSVDKGLEAVNSNSIAAVRFMLWIGLTHEDENLTEKQVGNMIEVDQLAELAEKMTSAMGGDMPAKPAGTATGAVVKNA